ncbi:MAG: SBBP repeat-containing protein [Fimbriimonadaceae bacterium]|nr:SBBP repeat-containing protein [Fimbriimonadaceae bacterium]
MLALTAAMVAIAGNPAVPQTASPIIPIGNAFIRNNGQWDPEARFLARSGGLDFWVTRTGFTLDFHRIDNGQAEPRVKGHVVKVEVVGASGAGESTGAKELPGKLNYQIGNPNQWATNVSRFEEARTTALIPGIDGRFYFDNGLPRYDLIVRPGANANDLKLRYEGASNLQVRNGKLTYETAFGQVEERSLFVYQKVDGNIRPVKASYVVNNDGTVGFSLGSFDTARPVIIDPVVWSTYLGGAANDMPKKHVTDGSGNIYVVGQTLSANFPTVTGSYDLALDGASDAFVTKFNAGGESLAFSTYLGGTGADDARGLAVTGSGAPIVVGQTTSGASFPVLGRQLTAGGGASDAFITQLANTGGALIYSSRFGGSAADAANAVVQNGAAAIVVGDTSSTNFPARTDNIDVRPFQFNNNGGQDAFINSINLDAKQFNWSTYVGGAGTDSGRDVAIVGGIPTLLGQSTSASFPGANYSGKPGYDQSGNGGTDAFLLGVSGPATAVSYYSFFGGSGNDTAAGLANDGATEIYIAGSTVSGDLPYVLGYQNNLLGHQGGYIARFNGNASELQRSTFYRGSRGPVSIDDIAIDPVGAVVVAGRTETNDLKLGGTDADRTRRGASDVFASRFGPDLNLFWYGTLLGGNLNDWASSVSVAGENVYVAGYTTSTSLPNTTGKFSETLAGGEDGYVALVTFPVAFTQFNNYGPQAPYRWAFDVRTDGGVYANTPITFTSDNGKFVMPTNISIPRGTNRSASFAVTPTPAGSIQMDETANLTATALGSTLNATVSLPAPDISAINFDSLSKPAGQDVISTLVLSSANPIQFIPVGLSLVNAGDETPVNSADAFLYKTPVVTVLAGQTDALFYIRSVARNTDLQVKVKGPKGYSSQVVTLEAVKVSALELSRPTIIGGSTSTITGTVRLTGRAPVGGTVVDISSSTDAANVPATVTVPAGVTSARFTFNTDAVATDTVATITAAANGSSQSNNLTITAPVLNSLTFNASSIQRGRTVRAKVGVSANAPAGGLTVAFTVTNPATGVTIPATATIPAGARSAEVTVSTDAAMTAPVTATIQASLNGVNVSNSFNITL